MGAVACKLVAGEDVVAAFGSTARRRSRSRSRKRSPRRENPYSPLQCKRAFRSGREMWQTGLQGGVMLFFHTAQYAAMCWTVCRTTKRAVSLQSTLRNAGQPTCGNTDEQFCTAQKSSEQKGRGSLGRRQVRCATPAQPRIAIAAHNRRSLEVIRAGR